MLKKWFIWLLCCVFIACTNQPDTPMHKKANQLIEAQSPYLLQHAYNPVNWYPWGNEALEKAKKEDKPILVSIGYSACHWCHVMERESFENDTIAALMNTYFINIKVDREERPDVDQIYMDAVQAMGQNGGWPLNVFLTPDQKPFYGGTYFPPNVWSQLLQNIADAFEKQRDKVEKSAEQLTNALATSELIKYDLTGANTHFDKGILDTIFNKLQTRFDTKRGGFNRAPKFPMPGNWQLLLQYYHYTKNEAALDQVLLTLDQIAFGGIYDQAGGGFARYSVDGRWLVPHFEKMLYDNGQLVSLYAEAYKLTKKPLYKSTVYQTIDWLAREMTDESGGFYAALDADSEGEEGKFYVWTQDELNSILGADAPLISDYYNTTEAGNWEHGNNILHRNLPDTAFAERHNLTESELLQKVATANEKLMTARAQRIRPGLDDKILAGWNGLMLKGLCDAYDAFGEARFLKLAEANAKFLVDHMVVEGKLYRSYKKRKAAIDAYLEDYAFVIDGLIALYQATFDEHWLMTADTLMTYANAHFYDEKEQFYYYTDKDAEALIARKKEIFDNVIPASNSQMAHNLYLLGLLLDKENYKTKATTMLSKMSTMLAEDPAYNYNWAKLYGYMATNMAEIAIVGDKVEEMRKQFASHYHPNKVLMGAKQSSALPLLTNKIALDGQTTVYVCYNKTCKLPVQSFDAALKQLN